MEVGTLIHGDMWHKTCDSCNKNEAHQPRFRVVFGMETGGCEADEDSGCKATKIYALWLLLAASPSPPPPPPHMLGSNQHLRHIVCTVLPMVLA